MALVRENNARRVIDLNGPDGNAFVIIGIVTASLRGAGFPKSHIDEVRADMMSGDYRHLVKTADRWIGGSVDFIIPDNWEVI